MDILEKEVDLLSIHHFQRSQQQHYSQSRELKHIQLTYFCRDSKFGKYLAAFIEDELCFLTFYDTSADLKKLIDKLGCEFNMVYHTRKEVKPEEFRVSEKLKIFLNCTDFQILVYKELLKVNRGETISYEELARRIGKPKSVRPVASAVAKNLIGYVIPCHRVIRKNGNLGNYGGGSVKKLAMLEYEGVKFKK